MTPSFGPIDYPARAKRGSNGSPLHHDVDSVHDLPAVTLPQIAHFFEHYKDLERGKWVKVSGWVGPEEAKQEILAGVAGYRNAGRKPAF